MSSTRDKVVLLARLGMAAEDIAAEIKMSISTVYYHLRKVHRHASPS